jgi:serine/threonine-protein kinase
MATDPNIDRLFDKRYLIRRKLGSGGMADVYLAEDQELGRRVALKLLNDRHASDDQFVERFRREAQNAAGLNHPSIVSIFDRGQAEGTYYIAMEFLDGRTLKALLVRNGPTPIPIAIDYSRQILGALAFAHRHGIVHRDIKPHNIVVGPDGRLKVTDFGIARSGASQMTEAGSIVGTAQYLSPEQARGAAVDPRSDLYSLGIVLYEMLTGSVPFTGDAPVEIAMKHLSSVPEPPSSKREEVPHDLDAVVMRALAKDPDQRYDSAEEMEADLARVARGLAVSPRTEEAMTQVLAGTGVVAAQTIVKPPPQAVAPPAPPPYRPASSSYYEYAEAPRRRSVWPWVLGVLAAVIAAGAGYLLYDRIQDQLSESRPISVQNVLGLTQENAREKLQEQELQVRPRFRAHQTIPLGIVIDQDPAAGDRVPKGSTVTIWVSSGKPKATVPELVGQSLTDALTALNEAGLEPRTEPVFNRAPPQTVVAQFPAAGEQVLRGSFVRVNVSQGPRQVEVPDVVGEPYENAAGALQGLGFVVDRVDEPSDAPENEVIGQEPRGNELESPGTTVTLTVSTGPSTAPVPSVLGQTEQAATAALGDAGFRWTVLRQDVFDPAQDGIVLLQDPAPRSELEVGSAITITVGRLASEPPPEETTPTTPSAQPPPSDTP